ncbi:MAG TPA: hypothetical protein ENG03_09170 [Thioploca sp.]|nr:hypothetical protein [Thioploca sp.]
MTSIKKKMCQTTIGVVSLGLTAAVSTVIAHDNNSRVTDIQLRASSSGTPPSGPAGYTRIGNWDVDRGGSKGTDGSTGHYMMALYTNKAPIGSLTQCVTDVQLRASSSGTPPSGPAGYTRIGNWDVDAGGSKGTNGSTGHYMMALYTSANSPVKNVALNKATKQSSQGWGGDPKRAVDGNTSGNYGHKSVTHTQAKKESWWQVDLAGAYDIETINVYNRTDCCGERLSNFYVMVSDTPFPADLNSAKNQANWNQHVAGRAPTTQTFTVGTKGRYVRVQLAGSNYLSLAEVEVMGRPATKPVSFCTETEKAKKELQAKLAAAVKAQKEAQAKLAAEKKAKKEALAKLAAVLKAQTKAKAKLAAVVKAQKEAQAKLAAEKKAKEEALAKLAACEKAAQAEVIGGNPVVQRAVTDSRKNFFLVDTNKPFRAEGELTWWKIWAGKTLPVELVIYRKSANSWAVVGRSGVKRPTKTGFNRFRLASPIEVQAGDFVGLYYPQAGSVSFNKDSGAWDLGNLTGTVLFTGSGAGATAFSGSSYRTYSVRAGGIKKSAGDGAADSAVSLQSVNYPGRHIRHRGFLGFIDPIKSELDRKDASFVMVPGLANSAHISFRSVNYPDRFLRHQFFRINLHPSDGSQLFKLDATFKKVPGLYGSGGFSFESVNYPNHYIRHSGFALYIHRNDGSTLFKKDVTFNVVSALFVDQSQQATDKAQAKLNKGLVAYYPFDGILNASGHGNLGTNIDQFKTNDFTVAFWFRTQEKSRLFDLAGDRTAGSHGNFLAIRMTGKHESVPEGTVTVEIDQDRRGTNFIGIKSTTTGLNDGNWHHVAAIRDGKSLALYIDGKLENTGKAAGIANIVNNNDFRLGRSYAGFPNAVVQYDNLRVYNDALTGNRVKALFVEDRP